MRTAHYQTVFEIGIHSFPWATVVQPIMFILLGLLIIGLAKQKTYYVTVGVFISALASLFAVISLVKFVPDFVEVRNLYKSGKGQMVEGTVQDFQPAPMLGPARESFSVRGVPFSYNAADASACFHNTPLHKGPLREGADVRIYYYKGCIQRVDVIQDTAHSGS